MDNLNEALKTAIPGGAAVPVTDETGKIIAYCGICAPNDPPYMGLLKSIVKEAEDGYINKKLA